MAESITGEPQPHYRFLDGLRGLAALCVVFDHAVRIGKGQLKGGWIYLDSIASKLGLVVYFLLQPLNLSPVQFILSMILIGCPLSIFASRCFFHCCEKYFCFSYRK